MPYCWGLMANNTVLCCALVRNGNKWAINSNIATNEVVAYTIFDLVGRAVYHGTALPSEMRQAQSLCEKLPQKGVLCR